MDINANSIAAAAATDLIKKSFESIVSGVTSAAKQTWQKLFEDFKPFMEETYNRNSRVRILCQKEKDVELSTIYIQSVLSCGMDRFTDSQVLQKINDGKNIVVTGNGGAGKTFFMRNLWLVWFADRSLSVPIFFELRRLNELTSLELATFIRLTISRKELTKDLFEYFCQHGKFCFFLDGFDEVTLDKRELLQKQILQLSVEYPKCRFVISSRYERRFAGWQNFEVYESTPFNIDQIKELIEKIPFDNSAKKLFLKRLNKDFFKRNESFLSNPLLAIIMMMTFRENMDIPKQMNNFYDQAFSTLYQWHDATKAYSRTKALDISEFQKSFGMFCLLSYFKEVYEFSKTEIIDYIEKSSRTCGVKIESELVLGDYEESVNLIRQDGLSYVFIHRSFQEYFSAYALIRLVPQKFADFIPNISKRTSDRVMITGLSP